VRTSLAEEIERDGLTVTPIGDTAAVAQRGPPRRRISHQHVVRSSTASPAFEYRSAPPNSVVVEFNVVPAS
jgi:hypothetical protein